MVERLAALAATLALVGGIRALDGPAHRLSDVVLIIGWGHLLGALLGDARRLQRAGFASRLPGGHHALALVAFTTCVAAGTALLASPLIQALLLACVFAHVFENEAAREGASRSAAVAGVAAPTLAVATLALGALSTAEAAALEPWLGTSRLVVVSGLLAAGFGLVALASRETRGRGAAALALLAAASMGLPARFTGVEVIASVAAYHFVRFALRMSRTPSGFGRVLAVHAAPAVVVALGVFVAPLAEVSTALRQPGLFLVGSFVHALHTAWPSAASAPARVPS